MYRIICPKNWIRRNRVFHLKFHLYAKKLRELATSKGGIAPFVILCYNRGKIFLISRSFPFVPHGCSRAEFLCHMS